MGISLDVFLRRLSDTGHTSHRLYSLEPRCEPADVLGERSASVRASFLCGAHRALLLHSHWSFGPVTGGWRRSLVTVTCDDRLARAWTSWCRDRIARPRQPQFQDSCR